MTDRSAVDTDHQIRLAEAVRAACLRAALEAYEAAGVSGLCGDGAFEVACGAIRTLDVERLVREPGVN